MTVSKAVGLFFASVNSSIEKLRNKLNATIEKSKANRMDTLRQNYPQLITNLDNFTKISTLGSNHHSTVFVMKDNRNSKEYIVKVYNQKQLKGSFEKAFVSEVSLPLKIGNQFIAKTIGFTDQYPYAIIQDYQPQKSLHHVLYKSSFYLTSSHRNLIAMCVAFALHKMHDFRYIHHNLTSSHILLDQYFLPHISSLGFSSTPESSTGFRQNLTYVAPELLTGFEATEKVDVYSYGMILYELLTNHPPFEFCSPIEIQSRLLKKDPSMPELPLGTPEPLKNLICSCWARDPQSRPSFHEIYEKFSNEEVYFDGFDKTYVASVVRSIKNDVDTVIPPWANRQDSFENSKSLYESIVKRSADSLQTFFSLSTSTNIDLIYNILLTIIFNDSDIDAITAAVYSILYLMIKDPIFLEYFIKFRIYEKIPLRDNKGLQFVLALLTPVFQINPQLASVQIIDNISKHIDQCPEKVLRLLLTICNRFSNDWVNWQIIDLLLVESDKFLNTKMGSAYLNTLYRLVATFDAVRTERGFIFAKIAVNGVDSTDPETVKIAYQILIVLGINSISPKHLADHITNTLIQPMALNYLTTAPVSIIDTAVLESLCSIQPSQIACSLLIKFAQDKEIAKEMLTLGPLLQKIDPKYMIKILIEIMIDPENRPNLIKIKELPMILENIVRVSDSPMIGALCKIIIRFPYNPEFVRQLNKTSFIHEYITQVKLLDTFETHFSCLNLIDTLCRQAFTPAYLYYMNVAVELPKRNALLTSHVITYLTLMSAWEEGAKKISRLPERNWILDKCSEQKDLYNCLNENLRCFLNPTS